ncbi:hypothetical protein KY346_03145 [Candidatus Woesearchaeota archaeon]|nr:hypothetical protein [Candidatus Woesearchaeota archaeon]
MNLSVKQMSKMILILTLLFLMLPYALRAWGGNVYLIDGESYYHARVAQDIVKERIPQKDTAVFNERDYVLNPYHVLLAVFTFIFGALTASKMVPLLLGLLCVYLFYLILSKFRLAPLTRLVIAGILILSPVFIYTFSVSSPACLILVLNLAGLFFLTKKGKLNTGISLACFSIASMFGILHALISAFIVFFYSFSYKKRLKRGYLIIAAIVFVLLSYALPAYLATEKAGFIKTDLISSFISDVGGAYGFSIFAILLALVGYALVWKYKQRYYSLYAFSILLIVYSFFNSSVLIYSNLIIVFLAGIAFVYFAKMKWSLKILRNFTLLVLFCGLLFSAVNTVDDLCNEPPNTSLINSLIWLKLNSEKDAKVFSHYSNGFWIEFIAERPVVLDGLLEQTPDAKNIYFDSRQILKTDDLDTAKALLSKYNVRYIVITKNMQEGLVWETEKQGLDFLLTNAETFKKIQENSYTTIYEYIYEGADD